MELGSKIYISGHTGLFGSTTMLKLKEMGYTNIVYRSHKELDLKDYGKTLAFLKAEQPEYIFCMAGKVGGIQANLMKMADFTVENLQMSINLIKGAHECKVKKLLYIGSSCAYPAQSMQPVKEEYILNGSLEPTNEGYAIAKIAGIKLCKYYNLQYGTNFISCIPSNVYGPRDSFDEERNHVVPALIKRFHEAKQYKLSAVEIWGSGRPTREFLYIDDAVDASIYLMKKYDESNLINIGAGEETSIKELAQVISEIVGFKGILKFDETKPDGMMRRKLDSRKMKALGWQPKVSLHEGVEKTYKWYLETKGEPK